ncbi:MAG: peptide ABC transporter substrate-binding protein [Halieaceae bacterium]|jgi:oligopeptide transport system substrate-binding protein|nr:peptide ABC transporter substrate-binding protein [Halieaceae bacterium]
MLLSLFRHLIRCTGPGLGILLAAAAGPSLAVPPAIDPENHEIAIAMTEEPQYLSSIKATDQISFMVLDHISEGLLTLDENNNLVAGVAERWELTDTQATFWLRQDARWSDGKPVTAHDFVFAWRRVVDPESASEYAFLMRTLTNGKAIIAGKLPPESLGVRALDDHTLVAELVSPTAYFLDLVTFISFRPVREDFFREQGRLYAAEAENLLSNGPYVLTRWVHGAAMRFEKNPHYWRRDEVALNAINAPYFTSDSNARFNLFMDDKIAMATSLDLSAMKMALQRRQKLKSFRDGTIFYIGFNHRQGRPTSNLALRRAMQSVYDAAELTYKVVAVPGNVPAYTVFPAWLRGDDGLSLQAQYPPQKPEINAELGRQYLAQAREELGVEEIPPLTLLLGDSPGANKQGEHFQNVMARTLGLDIRLDRQIFKQRLAKMSAGDYDLVGAGWGPDYNDAMTFADLFASWNLNNRGRYSNPEYDALVLEAQKTTDTRRRNQLFAQLQSLIHRDVVVLPQYERGYIYAQDKRLVGVRRSRIGGDPNFNYARIRPTTNAPLAEGGAQ